MRALARFVCAVAGHRFVGGWEPGWVPAREEVAEDDLGTAVWFHCVRCGRWVRHPRTGWTPTYRQFVRWLDGHA